MIKVLDNDYVTIFLTLFVVVYGLSLARLNIPPAISRLFNNDIFRVAFLSLFLIVNFKKAPHIALLVALIFVLTINYMS